MSYAVCEVTANQNLNVIDGYYIYYVDCTAGNIILSLQDCSNYDGIAFRIFRKDSTINTLTVQAYTGQNIDGSAYFALPVARSTREVVSFANNWFSY